MIEGLKLAPEADLVGYVDADGATPPAAFDDLITKCATADCVIGSRWIAGSVLRQEQTFRRQFASRVFHAIVQGLFWLNIRDTQCGAKVMRREAVEAIHGQLTVADMAFDINLLYALKHSFNNGLKFINFRVPRSNLLNPSRGDGLTIAYHGLNRGRVALCATAAGSMRVMLAGMLPWAAYRTTYGQAIERRELVQRRVGRLAALIVGCDALVDWCSWQLDEGYRGEMECIIAKIFGSESQKEAAIELCMKTHGGRAFLHGHLFGDNVHEYLAPCIYEGEGEMLGMAFLKSLVKDHGRRFFEPIGRRASELGLKRPSPLNPVHAWGLRREIAPYGIWKLKQLLAGWRRPRLELKCRRLASLAKFAVDGLQRSRLEIDSLMIRHQLKLPDRQVSMAELSQRIQDQVVMLITALWADSHGDPLVRDAAVVLGNDFRRRLTGRRVTGHEVRTATKLGAAIAENGFVLLEGIVPDDILMRYDDDGSESGSPQVS